MVKNATNRRGGTGRVVYGDELSAWNRLKRKLCMVNSF